MTSSTSSSKAKRRPGPKLYSGWGLVGLVMIWVALELTLFRNLDVYGKSPGFIGQIAELKTSLDGAEKQQIEVAVFGDSMSMDALRPEIMEDAAGLPAGSVFNFSLSGGSAYDMYQTYDRYADELPLKQAIVVVNEHQLNNAEAADDVKFRYFAGLGDRVKAMEKDNYGELLLGWVSKGYGLRDVWTMMLEKQRDGKLREEAPYYPGGLKPLTWSPKTDKTEEHAQKVADRWFENYDLSGVRTDALEKLLRGLHEDGVETTVLMIPRSDYFEDAVAAKHAMNRERFLQKVQGFVDEYDTEFEIMGNDMLNYDEDFRDTNHLSSAGAEKVSRLVAEKWLRAE